MYAITEYSRGALDVEVMFLVGRPIQEVLSRSHPVDVTDTGCTVALLARVYQ